MMSLFLCMGMTMKAEVTVESPWVGSTIEDGQTYYLYNVKAKAFMKGGNSWGTQASFGEDAMAFTAVGSEGQYALTSTATVQWWATAAYLGSDLYVDNGAEQKFGFNIVADGVYTFTLNDAYVAYTGNSVVGTVAEVNDGCYWQLLTAESIKQQMAANAGAATPYAATPLIAGANFGRSDDANSAWTGGPDVGGDNDNFCAEKWNAGISSVTQTLTGLPNGTYKLQAQGLYRMGGVDAAVALRDAGTEVYDVNFIANDSKVLVMSVMDEAGKLNGVGDNYGSYGAAPNNRNHASKFFNAGYYEHEVYFTVTDGTAVIGIANNTGADSDWLVFDNFRLTYYGTATVEEIEQAKLGEFFTAVEDLIAAAEAIEATYSEGAKAELDAAVAAGQAAKEALTKDALVAAVAPLQAAIARAERSVAINAMDLTPATQENPIDMTQFVANPDMETGDIKGWTATSGWQFQNNNQFENGDAVINRAFQERWVSGAALGNTSTEQTLLDMPNGVYSVTASIIATRQDAASPKEAATGVYLFAGAEKVAAATENNTPENFTVIVEVVDNALTFGIKGEDAQANWIAFDNVKLSYLGSEKAPEEPEVDPNDYTSYIKNADLSVDVEKDVADAGNWNTVGTKGISGGMVKVSSGATFDFSQIIALPAGQYKMTAQAAFRFGGDEQAEYDAIQAGTETHLVKLYAQTATYKYEANVQNRYEGASDTDYAAGSGSVTVNGKFVPNSSSAVQTWFNNGQYVNELVFNVQEDGEIKIGIANVGNNPGGEYTNIGAWTLTRLGDAEADPEVEEPTPDPDPTPDPEETIDMDVTNKVGTGRDAWEGNNGGPVTIDGISMPEKYETTTATLGDVMWQTVTGLENGKYTVELWANARYTSGRGFDSEAADGALDFTYLYANNVEISIEVYHNGGLNSGKSYKLEGVEVTDGTLKMGMTKKAAGSNWHTIQIKSLIYHAPANAALDMAKVDLQAALDAANAVDPKKDDFVAAIAAAQDVYDNSKSVEEVEATTASLKEATKLAILGNASPSNPVLTDFVVNGTFDTNGVVTPWKTTTSAQNQTTATNQQGAFTGNFFENWNPSAVTGKIYQVIENVPNGIYDLSICAFVNNFNGAVQFVYANADKVALTAGEPTAYTVRTIVENNTIEVGFEQTEAVANWMGIDNVSLTYLGEYSNDAEVNMAKANFTAAYDEFNAALAACQAMMLKTNFYEVADAADQLNAQLESTTDIEALNAMVAQLNEATASLNEINAVYAEYDVYVQKFKAAAEWSEPLTTEAAELLEYNMYGGAGMQAMSIDALKQAIEQIKADYVAYAGNAKLYDGNMFDFTYLIQNPNIDTDLAGWTLTGRVGRLNNNGFNGVPGIMEIGEWGATSWEAGVSQTLNELPNGKYIVKAAWMAASGIKMNFSANEASVEVVGIGDQGGNIAADGSVVEMGKGVQGWQYVEVEGIVENGVLTIAATASSAAQYQWSNADAFELYYAGDDCLYDLDEPIEGEWEDVTNKPNEYGWTIIDHAELLGLGDYWVATNDTRYDEERGVMEFVAGENAAASLIQEWCPFGQATYRLTGKAFHNGAVNAVMFVGDQTVEIPAAAEGATFENAEEYFTTFSIEFTCESAWGTQLNVGYSCEFDNAEDFLVVGGLKLEEKKSTTIKSIFMETFMALESLGYEVMNMEALYASQQAVMADAMPIYEAIMGGQKVLKSEVEQSIEDMQAVIAELNPVATYYKGEFMDALYAAEDFKWTLDEASQAYADLEAAINEANDVAAVTTVAELEAKVAALEELMKLIETGIDSIEAEVETVIYDLSGRRVTEMTKGVYIVNGKKVIKK